MRDRYPNDIEGALDDDTGVNYVVVSTERGNGEYSIAITPRLNADGSLYVKEENI